MDQILI